MVLRYLRGFSLDGKQCTVCVDVRVDFLILLDASLKAGEQIC